RLALFALLLTSCVTAPTAAPRAPQARADWSGVEAVLGRSGSVQPGNVYKFGFPRSDLDVRIGDVPLKPALALGSWAAFMELPNGQTMAMGDLVLTEGEISDVIS